MIGKFTTNYATEMSEMIKFCNSDYKCRISLYDPYASYPHMILESISKTSGNFYEHTNIHELTFDILDYFYLPLN